LGGFEHLLGNDEGIFLNETLCLEFLKNMGQTMVMGGYIAHYQIYPIFQGLSR
jgi:hypothetical protein